MPNRAPVLLRLSAMTGVTSMIVASHDTAARIASTSSTWHPGHAVNRAYRLNFLNFMPGRTR